MNKKIGKKFSVRFGLLMFLLLLPLENVRAGILCRLDPDYSPDYTYVYVMVISIIIAYAIVMLVLSHIFIKDKILLLKALLLFLILLILFFLNIVFSAIPAIIAVIVLSIILVWILSYISVKNKILFLKAFITLIALFVILSITNYFDHNKGRIKDLNTSIECKKSGGVLREGVCGTGHKYCSFLTADHGKACYDDNDCEEFCVIENIEKIKRIWDNNYPDNYVSKKYEHHLDHYLDIKKNDWISKTGIEIEGKCSKFKGEARSVDTCGNTFGEIQIKDGIIKRNKKCSSW